MGRDGMDRAMTRPALDGDRHTHGARSKAAVCEALSATHGSGRPLSVRDATARSSEGPEQRVIRQLVEALLFERLVPFQTLPRSIDIASDEVEAIYDLQFEFKVGPHDFRCLGTIGSFDRVRIAHGSIQRVSAGQPRSFQLDDIVTSLDISPEAQQRLLDELGQTLALCRWNRQNLSHQRAPRRRLGFQELESAIVEGHQYHPSFKTRTGFSLQDHEDYGPEAGNTFQLQWLAVSRTSLRIAVAGNEAAFWKRELGDSAYAVLCNRLLQQGGDFSTYALVPVHPWQLQSIGKLGIDLAIESRAILSLGAAGDRYHASQSIRTLVNATNPTKANVKLPLDIVCTSTHRNLEANFVCTAPALSDWLVSLVADDAFLQRRQHLLLLREYAGVIYESELPALKGRLGVIYRESVCAKLQDGEAAVPFTALTVVESDGRPFIAEWLSTHGVRRWAERLLEVMLVPLWHMLVHHGIAFESHAQNLVLVHRHGWPQKIVLRDFHEDTEFVPDYLAAPEKLPDFAAIEPFFATVPDDDGYRMASTDALRELFMDCVYVYNLADLSFLLARFFEFSEEDFWTVVRKHLRDYEASGVTDKARIDRVASDSSEITVESLLMKKIRNGAKLDFFEHQIRNTLHS